MAQVQGTDLTASDAEHADARVRRATVAPRGAGRFGGLAVLGLAAIALWVVGALPWIAAGLRLPISDAWPVFPAGGTPRVALPFGEYAFQALGTVGVIGGAAAVAVSLLAREGTPWPRLIAAAGGLLGLAVALAQTVHVVQGALAPRTEARMLVVALVLVALAGVALGLLAGAGLVRRKGWSWLLGAALVAALVGPWLLDLVHRGPASSNPLLSALDRWHPLLGGVLLGVALAACGLRSTGHLVGWVGALAILWMLPAALTALNYTTYYVTRVPLRSGAVAESLEAGGDVFVAALGPDARTLGPVVLAVFIGAGVLLWRSRRRGAPQRGGGPTDARG